MKNKIFLILIGLVLLILAGLFLFMFYTDMTNQPQYGNMLQKLSNEGDQTNTSYNNPKNSEDLFGSCKLNGVVREFSNYGCNITPITNIDNVSYSSAPGHEDEFEQVNVSYKENCLFQMAYANLQSEKISYGNASVDDIKKDSELIICGEYDENNTFKADRIFIYLLQK